jgi:DNA polymerase-3 subunit gamma/tau
VLARHASGSFRDALGTLEQLQTYAGAEIELADVLAVLGISDAELLFTALDAIAAADPRAALAAVADAVDGGHDPAAFIRELETHTRELLVVQMQGGGVPPELSLTPERDERLAAQAAGLSTGALVRTLDLLAAALTHLRAGADARTQLELALVKAARADLDPSLSALASRIEQLEPAAGARAPAPPAADAGPAPLAAIRPPTPAGGEDEAASPAEADPPAERVAAPEPNGSAATAAPAEPVVALRPSDPLTLERLVSLWPAVLDTVRASNAMLGAVVDDARPVELAGNRLVLAFGEDAAFLRKKAEERATRSALTDAVRAVTGHALTFSYELREGEGASQPLPLSEDELVARLKDEFDAEELADIDQEDR